MLPFRERDADEFGKLGRHTDVAALLPALRDPSLDELTTVYKRLKDNNVKLDHISDHGLSLGIYFRDPDGNGLEVSYELPRENWPRQEQVFAPDVTNLGLFPGPWDDDPAFVRRRSTATA